MSLAYWINQGWHWLSRREGVRFERATKDVAAVQQRLLFNILRRNAACSYGEKYGFSQIKNQEHYRGRVPVVRYEELRQHIHRIAAGEVNVLTIEPVVRLLPTSGSTAGVKYIPYTVSLKRDFQRAIAAWIWATFQNHPKAMCGRAYWSITPMGTAIEQLQCKIPIGFETDSEYLGVWSRWLAERLILPPASTSRISNIENARYANLLYLLASPDLALVSVWSPTFLLTLLNQLGAWLEPLCRDLRVGKVLLPYAEDSDRSDELAIRANPKRSDELQRLFDLHGMSDRFVEGCWPNLGLLSCWGDGNSAPYLNQLKGLFTHVPVQPKGLLSTECVVSFPWSTTGESVLAIRSHFYEFTPISDDGTACNDKTVLANELELGQRYRVVVTTSGGLYRYDLGDIVEVIGYDEQCPRIRFVGRFDAVSDLVGEKLHEDHVSKILHALFDELGLVPKFFLLSANESPVSCYVLWLSNDTHLSPEHQESLAVMLDQRLRSNPQYDLARNLRQLEQVQVKQLRKNGQELWKRFEEWQVARGKRVGDLKVNVLDYRGIWREFLSAVDNG